MSNYNPLDRMDMPKDHEPRSLESMDPNLKVDPN